MISTKRGSFSVVPMFDCTHLAAAPHDPAAFGEAELGRDRIEVVVGHELRADVRRAFFTCFRQQDHVAIERGVVALEVEHQHQAGDEVVFVVHGAAAVHVSAVSHRAERRMGPLGRIDRDDVGVAEDQDRPLLAVALDARDDVGARGILGEHLVWNAFLLEDRLQVVDRLCFVARRAAGVDLQQRLEMLNRFGFERGVGRLLLLR